MLHIEVTGPETIRWKVKTRVPNALRHPLHVQRLWAQGMELDIILNNIQGIPKVVQEPSFEMKPDTHYYPIISNKKMASVDTQCWYGDDARFIWHFFMKYYAG